MRRFTCFALLISLAAILAVGCGGQTEKKKVAYTLARKSGNPVLTMGKLTIAFEGIQMEGADAALSDGFFFVPHAGAKVEGGTSTVNELKIRETVSKDDTTNTVELNRYSFNIIEKGTKIRIGEHTLPIDEGPPKKVVVPKEGAVKVN